jgi:hypothetical protein
VFPDIGASFLFHLCRELGAALGTSGARSCSPPSRSPAGDLVLLHAGRVLLARPRRALLFVLLVLGGGLLRVLPGTSRCTPSCCCARAPTSGARSTASAGRCSTAWAALAFGAGLDAPLVQLSRAEPARRRAPAPADRGLARTGASRRGAGRRGAGARLPDRDALGRSAELAQASETLLLGGFEPSPVGTRRSCAPLRRPVRGRATRSCRRTPQYLANAFFLLVPSARAARRAAGRRAAPLVATPQAIFLSCGALFMLLYALVVRPVWGRTTGIVQLDGGRLPLAAHLLVQTLPDPPLADLGVLLVGATLSITIPFVAIGIAPTRDAGPPCLRPVGAGGESSRIRAQLAVALMGAVRIERLPGASGRCTCAASVLDARPEERSSPPANGPRCDPGVAGEFTWRQTGLTPN